MSQMNGWNGGDPFAPERVEESIARSLGADAPATPTTALVRTLADAYTLPPAADAVLAHSRATLARRAAALDGGRRQTGGLHMSSTDLRPSPARLTARPPQPPRRRLSRFEAALRTAAAVLVVALLSAGFYALFHGALGLGKHPTPTPTPGASTPTTAIPAQTPAPAGVYVISASTLFRLNLSTGAIQKSYPGPAGSQAHVGAPVMANGMVYFTYTGYSVKKSAQEYDVVALSATVGAQVWRTSTAAELVQLTLANGTLYGGTAIGGTGGGSDTFYALRASDGSVLWTFHTAALTGLPSVADGVVYLADQPQNTSVQHLHALRASDGSQLWDIPLPQTCGIAGVGAVDQGTVFVGCDLRGGNGTVYALRASDGSMLWQSVTNGQPSVAAARAGLVYVFLGGKNAAGAIVSDLDALDEVSGAARWQVANPDGPLELGGTTVYAEVASSSAFTAPASSNLEAFSASNGALLWTYSEANQRIEPFAPVIAGGVVYVGLNGRVVAISAASGRELWRSPSLIINQQELGGLSVVAGG